ncbi:helix-turn-helix domain-containing protein [Candidatus Methylobacter oryzae]|uniref:Helix-turn-helix domain-containing protein n=1 Tax=Candidatus Methylobacter oryzae TaxID=2497749 RepID=A0ABY3C9F1_9GAMM|nr:helix-turn-helix domain-containing protein [Candidatus Methylobacter oryzae]TRW93322.1 helix-turn-helix domain-containing protein [Candidatus Methylobacter oryzae]
MKKKQNIFAEQYADELLDAKQASDFLHVSVKTLANWRSSGKVMLPFVKLGGRVLYHKGVLLEEANRRSAISTAQARLLVP